MPVALGLLLRIAVTYVYLLLAVRLAGKRTLKEATPFDLVIGLVVGDLPDDVIYGEVPLLQGLVAMSTLVALHVVVSMASARSTAIERLVVSSPRALIRNGRLSRAALRDEHVRRDEVESLLRLQGVQSVAEVDRADLEPSGDLSMLERPERRPATRGDLAALRDRAA